MLRTALRNVLAHKTRLMMTVLAVMLGVAFVSGTLVFSDSVVSAYRGAYTKNLKDVDVSVQAESDAASSGATADEDRPTALTGALIDKVRAVPGVTSVRPVVDGSVTLAAADGRPLNADDTWENVATNYVPDNRHGERDSRFPLRAGRLPRDGTEIALDRRTAEKAGYALGDTVRFAIDGPALSKKLVGTVDSGDPRVTAGGSLALFDTRTAQRLFLRPGQADELAVGSAPGTDNRALAHEIRALLPAAGITVTDGAQLVHDQAAEIVEGTKGFTRVLMAFAGIALFVGAFLITNTFTMLVAQRGRETALLRAVGASRRQVVRAVLVEAGLLGLVSSAAGFVIGLGIAAVLRPLLNASGAGLPAGPLVLSTGAFVWSLVTGVGVTVLAAWLPARNAAKVAPVEALGNVDQTPRARSMVFRNCLGALFAAAGVAVLLYVSAQRDGADDNLLAAALGSSLTLTGVIVLAPLLSRPLVRLAGALTGRLFGVSGRLATQNALRNPRRTAATASALMIGLTLITGLSVAGHSLDAALRDEAVRGMTADYQVTNTAFAGLDPALGAKVAAVPGVAATASLASAGLGVDGKFTSITGADPRSLGKVTDLRFHSGSLKDLAPGEVLLSDRLAEQKGLTRGDTFDGTLFPGDQHRRLTVAGVYQYTRVVGDALGTMDDVLPHADGGKLDSILVKAASGQDTGGLDQDIRQALGNSPLLQVRDQEQLTKAESHTIALMLDMMYGLLGTAVVIAVLGVVNTLAMSVIERTREIGLLRAIGLDHRGIKQMVRLESVVICLFGAVLGIGTGVFLAWACGGLARSSLRMYQTLPPWPLIGLFLLLALTVGVLAAVWPARRATRTNMLRSINAQ